MRRSAPLLLSVLSLGLLAASARPAHAQAPVSAADREAARDLFKEGYDLQKSGRYADALDRFRRSQQVFPAPTALLHIAECEVQLLQLVEAAETYRAIARLSLPEGSPPAFVAAQTQGAAELQQIEPRIPHLRIDVHPSNIPNLVVLLDDQQVNPALLDVARPVDPGPHKLSAGAPGYERLEGMVTIEETGPMKTVVLALKPGYSAPMVVPMGSGSVAPGMGGPPGQVVYVGQSPPASLMAAGTPAPTYYKPLQPATTGSRLGLFFGLRLGAVVPEGSSDLTNAVGPGFSFGGEVNFRFARRLFVGVLVEHGFLGSASSSSGNFDGADLTPTFSTTNFDAVFGVLTNPDRFGALFQAGFGYREVNASLLGQSQSASSPELTIGSGLWIPTGRFFRIVPRVDATFGSLSGGLFQNGASEGYAMITFNVGGYVNLDFH